MQRALYIFLILYFPLLAAALADLLGGWQSESFLSWTFRALFLLWLFDGLACLVAGLIVLQREFVRRDRNRMLRAAPLALAGVVLGLPPNYLLVELALKMVHFLRQ